MASSTCLPSLYPSVLIGLEVLSSCEMPAYHGGQFTDSRLKSEHVRRDRRMVQKPKSSPGTRCSWHCDDINPGAVAASLRASLAKYRTPMGVKYRYYNPIQEAETRCNMMSNDTFIQTGAAVNVAALILYSLMQTIDLLEDRRPRYFWAVPSLQHLPRCSIASSEDYSATALLVSL